MRKLALAALTVLAITFGTGGSALGDGQVPSKDLAQLSWKTPISTDYAADQPFTKLWVTQGFQGGMPLANIPHLTSMNGLWGASTEAKLCDQLDATCLPADGWSANGYGNFQLCATSPIAPCIRGLKYADADGNWHDAVLSHEADLSAPATASADWLKGNNWGEPGSKLEEFQTKWGWAANESIGLPGSGKGPLVFKFPGRKNAAGVDTYALDANFTIEAAKSGSAPIAVKVTDFNFQISPVKELTCNNPNVSVTVTIRKPNGFVDISQTGGSCIDPALYTTPTSAGFATKFADDFPIQLDLEMPNALSGWFQGRLDAPNVFVSSLSAKTSAIQIVGKPISVPITNKALALTDPKNQALLGSPEFNWARNAASYGYLGITGGMWMPQQGVDVFNKWAPYLDSKARGSASMWTISHFSAADRCMNGRDGLQGLVTTNAMVYQPATPTYEKGFLNYKVAGVHYDQDGSVVQGTYNFIMKDSVARCLYGFSSAPISGTVSVTSSSGADQQVALTSVTDKNGWLKLSALGFTFSSKTIKAKLTQTKGKTTTITCSKGKTIRKVTGVGPKCPAGYFKK